MFTETEIIAIFKAIDTNNSGKLDINEFYRGFTQLFPSLSKQTIVSLFRMQDKDHNGVLDIQEFITLVRFMEKKVYDDDPFVILFDKCDLDGNGVLDIVEFCLIWKCIIPDIDTDAVVKLFKAADDDGNGVVDFNEYMDLVATVKRELGIK